MRYCIGVDMGGTNTRIGLFTREGDLLERRELPTRVSSGWQNAFSDISACIRDIAGKRGIPLAEFGIGIGIPGPVEADGYVESCVNLNMVDFHPDKSLSQLLEGAKVCAVNDSNAAALGEMWQGGGKGYRSLVVVTLGTGVGSGIIINEKILYGAHGLAGEIGHTQVNPDEPEICNCGGRGCLDQMASATGIVRNARRMLEKTDEASLLRGMQGMTAKDVLDAAKQGDAVACRAVDYCMRFLGKSLADVSYVADPEVFVIGGGLSNAGDYLLDVIYGHYKQYPKLKQRLAGFVLARLGADAGMYGAARLALDMEENTTGDGYEHFSKQRSVYQGS